MGPIWDIYMGTSRQRSGKGAIRKRGPHEFCNRAREETQIGKHMGPIFTLHFFCNPDICGTHIFPIWAIPCRSHLEPRCKTHMTLPTCCPLLFPTTDPYGAKNTPVWVLYGTVWYISCMDRWSMVYKKKTTACVF